MINKGVKMQKLFVCIWFLFLGLCFAQDFVVDDNFCKITTVENSKGVIERGSSHGFVKEEKGYVYARVEDNYDFDFPIAEIEIEEIYPESSVVSFKNVLWHIDDFGTGINF